MHTTLTHFCSLRKHEWTSVITGAYDPSYCFFVLDLRLPFDLFVYPRLIIGILFLCIYAHLTVLLFINTVLNLTFSFLLITSNRPHASATDSILDY